MTWRPPRPTWVQFTLAWRLVLGTLVIAWGVVVTAREASWSLPWVLVTGAGLLGLRLSVPWERDRDDGA